MRLLLPALFIFIGSVVSAACNTKAHEARLMDIDEAVVRHQQIAPQDLGEGHVAYNASIAQMHNDYVMAFRVDAPTGDGNGPMAQHLAVMALDSNFNPLGGYQLLPTPHEPGCAPSAEDPRLIMMNNVPYVIYNAAIKTGIAPGRRMYVARLSIRPAPPAQDSDEGPRIALDAVKELHLADPGCARRVEKNWTPFVYDDTLHLIYQTNPPRVYRLDMDTLDDDGAWAVAQFVSQSEDRADFSFGDMRGGTPAIFAPELGQYISFFHGAQDANFGIGRQRYYMMGAYTFDQHPPFTIRSLTKDPFSVPEPGERPLGSSRIVYPQGLVDDGDNYVVSYGRNDNSIYLLTFDKQGIFDRLAPAHSGH